MSSWVESTDVCGRGMQAIEVCRVDRQEYGQADRARRAILSQIVTQVTLIDRMADDGGSNADWARFFAIYYPAMVAFAEGSVSSHDAEEIAQEALVKLLGALSSGGYRRQSGAHFRAYVKAVLRNSIVDALRRQKSERERLVGLDDVEPVLHGEDAGGNLDAAWRVAIRRTAVKHVLHEMPIAPLSREIYRAVRLDGRDKGAVMREFGVSRRQLNQIVCRIDSRIAAVEAYYED